MTQTMTDDIADFLTELTRQEVAEKIIRAYRADLAHIARWFATATDEPFRAAAVTPTDVRDYKAHLVSVERRQPATVNRRLATLRCFCPWAKAAGSLALSPVTPVVCSSIDTAALTRSQAPSFSTG